MKNKQTELLEAVSISALNDSRKVFARLSSIDAYTDNRSPAEVLIYNDGIIVSSRFDSMTAGNDLADSYGKDHGGYANIIKGKPTYIDENLFEE